MQPLKAHVRNGRLLLDEPTDLPEGHIIELVPVERSFVDIGDELDDEERARLLDAIERGVADGKAGRTVSARDLVEALRSRA